MGFDRKYLVLALVYAALGMVLGIYMAASHDHGHRVTHAHVVLVGFVVSLIYAIIHKLWLPENLSSFAAKTQFYIHQAGALGMSVGLFLLYGQHLPIQNVEPILGASSIAVLVAMLLMLVMVAKPGKTSRA
jgi:hypothetical protein